MASVIVKNATAFWSLLVTKQQIGSIIQ